MGSTNGVSKIVKIDEVGLSCSLSYINLADIGSGNCWVCSLIQFTMRLHPENEGLRASE